MIFQTGHGDIAVGFDEGEFEFGWHLGEGEDIAVVDGVVIDDVEFEANELIARVSEVVTVEASAAPALLAGTGAQVGSVIYLISQDSPGVISPVVGLDTEELEQPTGVTWSDVTYTFVGAEGPGLFSLFEVDNGAIDFGFSETLGNNSFTFAAGGHEERNFAFTELGTYDITITAEATRTENGLSQDFNATETFTFRVIPEPSSALLLAGSTLGLLLLRRRN